jgi:transcriptional regulator with XRE-family HTH domain
MAKRKPRIQHADIVRAFAERLRGTRLARGITQRDLAQRAHVTFSYISRLEAGAAAPGIDMLERLAQALEVSAVDLLPAPSRPETAAESRAQVQGLFDAVMAKAGQETFLMLKLFLTRLAESPVVTR